MVLGVMFEAMASQKSVDAEQLVHQFSTEENG